MTGRPGPGPGKSESGSLFIGPKPKLLRRRSSGPAKEFPSVRGKVGMFAGKVLLQKGLRLWWDREFPVRKFWGPGDLRKLL